MVKFKWKGVQGSLDLHNGTSYRQHAGVWPGREVHKLTVNLLNDNHSGVQH